MHRFQDVAPISDSDEDQEEYTVDDFKNVTQVPSGGVRPIRVTTFSKDRMLKQTCVKQPTTGKTTTVVDTSLLEEAERQERLLAVWEGGNKRNATTFQSAVDGLAKLYGGKGSIPKARLISCYNEYSRTQY